VLHALSRTGDELRTVPVEGATNVDWEDLAVRGHDLFIGDIGDNRARRPAVTVYRVPEPIGATARPTATIQLRYPGGPTDAEALLADPRSDDLIVLTKDWDGDGTRILRTSTASTSGMLEDQGELSLATGQLHVPGDDLVTGAAISPDGATVFVRTYGRVLAFTRRAGESVVDALRRPPCAAPSAPERQGETVAADGTGYLTLSEGAGTPIHRFVSVEVDARHDEHRPVWPVVALGVAVLAVLAVVVRRARRR
jgi:hypothetical protein